ncbi:MAG: endonuclease III [Nitrospirota bacterium]
MPDKNKDKLREILRRLKKEYPGVRTALRFRTPFELLVATILSAQSTDTQVNRITEDLFRKYVKIEDYAHARPEQLQRDVSSVNFYKNKARSIQGSARMILEMYGGEVPRTMQELLTLPGVARKTANIVLSNAFGINEGVAVDTHVGRLSQRLGLTRQDDPVKIEKDLMALTPRADWSTLSHLLIFHGRKVCVRHGECVLYDICPSRNI